eukprot:68601-Prymnesium_polylepis.1
MPTCGTPNGGHRSEARAGGRAQSSGSCWGWGGASQERLGGSEGCKKARRARMTALTRSSGEGGRKFDSAAWPWGPCGRKRGRSQPTRNPRPSSCARSPGQRQEAREGQFGLRPSAFGLGSWVLGVGCWVLGVGCR